MVLWAARLENCCKNRASVAKYHYACDACYEPLTSLATQSFFVLVALNCEPGLDIQLEVVNRCN